MLFVLRFGNKTLPIIAPGLPALTIPRSDRRARHSICWTRCGCWGMPTSTVAARRLTAAGGDCPCYNACASSQAWRRNKKIILLTAWLMCKNRQQLLIRTKRIEMVRNAEEANGAPRCQERCAKRCATSTGCAARLPTRKPAMACAISSLFWKIKTC